MKSCSKPACGRPGAAVLAYDYSIRRALISDLPEGELSPHLYALCSICADGLRPPVGWELVDARAPEPLLDEALAPRLQLVLGRGL